MTTALREIAVMQQVAEILDPLTPETRRRVLAAAACLLGFDELAIAILEAPATPDEREG